VAQRPHHRRRPRRAERSAADPLVVRTLLDALQLALELPAAGVVDEALVMIRHDGIVTRMVADPLGDARLWRPPGRYPERGDERVLHVMVVPEVRIEPPDAETINGFERLRAIWARLGHLMIDLIRTDGASAQSLSVALHPEAAWPAASSTDR
jgi:hypothetical protein